MSAAWTLDILEGSHLECAGLTALCWPAALTQAPTADASKNSQQAFQVHFEDKSLRNVCFKNVANFSVLVWGAVKPAPMKAASSRRIPRSRDRWSWLKNVQTLERLPKAVRWNRLLGASACFNCVIRSQIQI